MSDKYISAPLPKIPDGRTYITDELLHQEPTLQSVLKRGNNFWQYDILLQTWLSPERENN